MSMNIVRKFKFTVNKLSVNSNFIAINTMAGKIRINKMNPNLCIFVSNL